MILLLVIEKIKRPQITASLYGEKNPWHGHLLSARYNLRGGGEKFVCRLTTKFVLRGGRRWPYKRLWLWPSRSTGENHFGGTKERRKWWTNGLRRFGRCVCLRLGWKIDKSWWISLSNETCDCIASHRGVRVCWGVRGRVFESLSIPQQSLKISITEMINYLCCKKGFKKFQDDTRDKNQNYK